MRREPDWAGLREDLGAMHRAALAAADPAAIVARALRLEREDLLAGGQRVRLEPGSRVWLVAFGKAAPGMARAACAALGGRVAAGVVAHPRALEAGRDWPPAVRCFPAGHPLPDEGSLRAGEAALALVERAEPEDVVLVLGSGGGSALFEALRPGVSLEDVRRLTEALQHGGADIVELNVVRRALSRLKGGGLARAAGPARVVTLLLSDVIGDPPEAIASGPTVESPTGTREALELLERRGLVARFPTVASALREAGVAGGAPAGARLVEIVGSNRLAAAALAAEALERGFRTLFVSDRMQGEAREIGRCLGGIARGMRERGLPLAAPACLVLGGETTVTVRGPGRGGRNLELALGAALALDGCPRTAVWSFATDGVDGSSGAAGALATGDTLARGRAAGWSAHRALAESDTAPYFEALGDLWTPGPSGTNVNDLVVALVYP
jgi:hydroxypyruvate reductase